MTRNRAKKPYWEMTTEELAAATAEFEEEHVEDQFTPLSPKNRARWQKIQARLLAHERQNGKQVIAVHLDKLVLQRCTALAKKKRISWDVLVALGLKVLLAAEGEEKAKRSGVL